MFSKYLFDRIVAFFGLLFLWPLLLIVALLIKKQMPGPVLFVQKRVGKGGKVFNCHKFRSMKVNSPDLRNNDGSTFNSENDLRVTKVGHFLRETSIDEIPQIFNIFKGDMSIIGPRPGDVESKDTYEADEKDKLLIRPGITGYTQAYYRNSLGVRDKRLYDAWYAHNVSLILDVKIFFKSICTVLKRENVYTNDTETKTMQHYDAHK